MKYTLKLQLFLLMLSFGFLAGPRVIEAIPKTLTGDNGLTSTNKTQTANTLSAQASNNEIMDPYELLSLEAQSVYVWDIATHRKLYGKNEYNIYPLASITKMMSAVTAVDLLSQNTEIIIEAEDITNEGDTGLRVGEKWLLEDLLKFSLITSSNDGMSAIARHTSLALKKSTTTEESRPSNVLFVHHMNEKGRSIGLSHTHFNNETGLDINPTQSGAYGTARDMAMLYEYILQKYPNIFEDTSRRNLHIISSSNVSHHITNTNTNVEKIAGIVASKTGYTDLAGGNLGVIVDIGISHPVVIVVLGSTREGRFTDVEKLIYATIKKVTSPIPDNLRIN